MQTDPRQHLPDHVLTVMVNADRPDFRVFWSFLWGDDHNIDSDGDSYNPASRTWTMLTMASREISNTRFEIVPSRENKKHFKVCSKNEFMTRRVAWFLARETNGIILNGSEIIDADVLATELGDDFNLDEALHRADTCVWRKSTLENKYPNRDGY